MSNESFVSFIIETNSCLSLFVCLEWRDISCLRNVLKCGMHSANRQNIFASCSLSRLSLGIYRYSIVKCATIKEECSKWHFRLANSVFFSFSQLLPAIASINRKIDSQKLQRGSYLHIVQYFLFNYKSIFDSQYCPTNPLIKEGSSVNSVGSIKSGIYNANRQYVHLPLFLSCWHIFIDNRLLTISTQLTEFVTFRT